MMLGSGHLISGLDVATGTFVLMIFSAGVALVVLVFCARSMLRRAGQSGTASVWWVCGLALVGRYARLRAVRRVRRSTNRPPIAARIEARAAELTARSLAPGSALGCLDAVASIVVENACERPLFASPEAVAAAVAYVDARFSLLAASAALAERDPSYQPVFERLRRGLEADRYGLVAHVLMTRGCNGADCAELRLLRDPARVVANMKARAFETSLGAHALAWQSNGSSPAVASAPPPIVAARRRRPAAHRRRPRQAGLDRSRQADRPLRRRPSSIFPSASSIPAVSIMNPEPARRRQRNRGPARRRRSARRRPSRRQSAREAAAPSPPRRHRRRLQPPAPPPQVAPEAAPEPARPPARPDPHSTALSAQAEMP